jgi:hypothetical protein
MPSRIVRSCICWWTSSQEYLIRNPGRTVLPAPSQRPLQRINREVLRGLTTAGAVIPALPEHNLPRHQTLKHPAGPQRPHKAD